MIKFGTDGWRAIISEDFTFDNVRIVAQAIADFFNATTEAKSLKNNKLIVGYDTRFLSETYAKLIAEVLAANKIRALLVNSPAPTPAICVKIRNSSLLGGIIVTASHNPYQFNGIKIKASFGGPATPEMTKQMESYLEKNKVKSEDLEIAVKTGMVTIENIDNEYMKTVKKYLNMKAISNCKYKLLVDSMGGAGTNLIERILKNTSIKIESIRSKADPTFGGTHPEPIVPNLKTLISMMKKGTYDLAIANDGDADRIGAFTANGDFITPGQILGLLILHFYEYKKWKGAVVKTISNSTMIEKICAHLGIKLYETPVGFKHICEIMQNETILAGGEESGGIGVANYAPERDGILLGLLLLELMATYKKPIKTLIDDMEKRFGKYKYHRIDMHYPEGKKKPLMKKLKSNPPKSLAGIPLKEVKTFDGVKYIAEDESWLLLRLSGTEPKLRIYAESKSMKRTKSLIEFGKKIADSI